MCSVFMAHLSYTLPFLHVQVVCVVFGTGILTSLYVFGICLVTYLCASLLYINAPYTCRSVVLACTLENKSVTNHTLCSVRGREQRGN